MCFVLLEKGSRNRFPYAITGVYANSLMAEKQDRFEVWMDYEPPWSERYFSQYLI